MIRAEEFGAIGPLHPTEAADIGLDLMMLAARQIAIGAATVTFAGECFTFDTRGEAALCIVQPVDDSEIPRDIIAIAAADPCRFARLTGASFALGETALINPASFAFGRTPRVVAHPIDYLRRSGDGICILSEDHHEIRRRIGGVPRLIVDDENTAQRLAGILAPLRPRPILLVKTRRRAA